MKKMIYIIVILAILLILGFCFFVPIIRYEVPMDCIKPPCGTVTRHMTLFNFFINPTKYKWEGKKFSEETLKDNQSINKYNKPLYPLLYSYFNDSIEQKVEVKNKTEKSFDFTLTSENKKTNEVSRIEGQAVLKEGDPEIDEDEEGNAYPVNEYIFEQDGCFVFFRLDKETESSMKITESMKCIDKHGPSTPFSSDGKLIKQDNTIFN